MKSNANYISILITILFIGIFFVGCSAENTQQEITSGTTASAVTAEISTADKQSTLSAQSARETTSEKSTADHHNSTTAATAKKTTTQKSTTIKNTVNKTTKKAAATATTASSVTCSIEIECTNVLNNMDKLKTGHEAFVPSDGIIMQTQTVTVDSGSTAYDALKSACSKNSITMNTQKSAYGTYIKGFNNIDEFDCGKQSGWVYTVNGSSPPKSCDKYTVSQGDRIVFSFVC